MAHHLLVLGLLLGFLSHHARADYFHWVVPKGQTVAVPAVMYQDGNQIILRQCPQGVKTCREPQGKVLGSLAPSQYRYHVASSIGLNQVQVNFANLVIIDGYIPGLSPTIDQRQIEKPDYLQTALAKIDSDNTTWRNWISYWDTFLASHNGEAPTMSDLGGTPEKMAQAMAKDLPNILKKQHQAMPMVEPLKAFVRADHVVNRVLGDANLIEETSALPDGLEPSITGITTTKEFLTRAFEPFVKAGVISGLGTEDSGATPDPSGNDPIVPVVPPPASTGGASDWSIQRAEKSGWAWAACAQAVLRHFGLTASQAEIVQLASGRGDEAMVGDPDGIAKVLSSFGLQAETARDLQSNPAVLHQRLDQGQVVLAVLDAPKAHPVLLVGKTRNQEIQVVAADSAPSTQTLPELVRRSRWKKRVSVVIQRH